MSMSQAHEHRCLDFPDLEALISLPPEAPARRALADCPRCGARLSLLAEFLEDKTRPAGARPEAAARALRRAMAAELGAGAGAASRRQPGLRLAWRLSAGLAMLACVVTVGALRGWFAPELVERWRGEVPNAELALLPAHRDPTGDWLLSWRALPGAASYRVDLLDADLQLLGSVAAADTLLRLSPAALPAQARSPLAWQVTALATESGAALAQSPLGLLPSP
jgi:hypothetical protein